MREGGRFALDQRGVAGVRESASCCSRSGTPSAHSLIPRARRTASRCSERGTEPASASRPAPPGASQLPECQSCEWFRRPGAASLGQPAQSSGPEGGLRVRRPARTTMHVQIQPRRTASAISLTHTKAKDRHRAGRPHGGRGTGAGRRCAGSRPENHPSDRRCRPRRSRRACRSGAGRRQRSGDAGAPRP